MLYSFYIFSEPNELNMSSAVSFEDINWIAKTENFESSKPGQIEPETSGNKTRSKSVQAARTPFSDEVEFVSYMPVNAIRHSPDFLVAKLSVTNQFLIDMWDFHDQTRQSYVSILDRYVRLITLIQCASLERRLKRKCAEAHNKMRQLNRNWCHRQQAEFLTQRIMICVYTKEVVCCFYLFIIPKGMGDPMEILVALFGMHVWYVCLSAGKGFQCWYMKDMMDLLVMGIYGDLFSLGSFIINLCLDLWGFMGKIRVI